MEELVRFAKQRIYDVGKMGISEDSIAIVYVTKHTLKIRIDIDYDMNLFVKRLEEHEAAGKKSYIVDFEDMTYSGLISAEDFLSDSNTVDIDVRFSLIIQYDH